MKVNFIFNKLNIKLININFTFAAIECLDKLLFNSYRIYPNRMKKDKLNYEDFMNKRNIVNTFNSKICNNICF